MVITDFHATLNKNGTYKVEIKGKRQPRSEKIGNYYECIINGEHLTEISECFINDFRVYVYFTNDEGKEELYPVTYFTKSHDETIQDVPLSD